MAVDDNTLDFSGFASPFSAGQSGIGGFVAPTIDDPSTSTSQTGNAGSLGTNATAVAKALKDLQTGLAPPAGSGGTSGPSGTPAGSASSQAVPGSPAGINALMQMLMQRSNQYFPGQPNRQPVALARPSGGGLLGI